MVPRSSVLVLFACGYAAARVFYVAPAPDGSDAAAGTQAAPWATIQRAADTLGGGDTVYVRAGTYHEQVVPAHSGSHDAPAVYAAYPGEEVIVDGTGVGLQPTETRGLFHSWGRSHIRVQGIHFANSGCHGIVIGMASHVVISGCHTSYTNGAGVIVSELSDYTSGATSGQGRNDNIIVEGTEVEYAHLNGSHEAISLSLTDTFAVRNNHLHHFNREGIDIKFGSCNGVVSGNVLHDGVRQGLYIDAWSNAIRNIEVCSNTVYRCLSGFDISTERETGSVEDVQFHHNVIYACNMNGVWITTWGANSLRARITIHNNTIVANGWARVAEGGPPHGGLYFETTNVEDIDIRNNLFSRNCSHQLAVQGGTAGLAGKVTVAYNLIDGHNTDPLIKHDSTFFTVGYNGIYALPTLNPITGDPMLVDTEALDFRIEEGSAAVDAGDPDSRYNDPDGSRCDVGAFPLGSGTVAAHAPAGPRPGRAPSMRPVVVQGRWFDLRGVATGARSACGVVVTQAGRAVPRLP